MRSPLPLYLLALTAIATPALADDQTEGTDGVEIRYAEITEISYESRELEGVILKPRGGVIFDVKRAQFSPMVKLRSDFRPEMQASVDEVK